MGLTLGARHRITLLHDREHLGTGLQQHFVVIDIVAARDRQHRIGGIDRQRLAPRARGVAGAVPGGKPAHRLTQQIATHVDADIGASRCLHAMDRNGALAGDRFVVAGGALALQIAAIGGLADQEVDAVNATVLGAAIVLRIDFVVEVTPAEHQHMFVIDRHLPTRHGNCGVALFGRRGYQRGGLHRIRKLHFGDAHPDLVIADAATGREADAVAIAGRLPLDDRHLEEALTQADTRADCLVDAVHRHIVVQGSGVEMVDQILVDLQPVAGIDIGKRHQLVVCRHDIGVEHLERRLLVRRPHIGEHQTIAFKGRIGTLKDTVLHAAVARLAGRLNDAAVDVVLPAVIATADALVLDDAVFERGTTMRAMSFKQANPATAITEGDQLLAHDLHRFRYFGQFL